MRRVTALLIVMVLLGLPALARAAVTTTTPLSPTAPPWLTQTSPAPTTTVSTATGPRTGPATPEAGPSATATTPSGGALPSATGNLPYTGDNLLPEAIAAGGLLLGGVALRLRLR